MRQGFAASQGGVYKKEDRSRGMKNIIIVVVIVIIVLLVLLAVMSAWSVYF